MIYGSRYSVVMVAVIGAMCVAASPVWAGPWSNASGANAAFGWSGGQNNTGRFGDPVVSESGFLFAAPVDFRADGGGGVSDSATDFARVTANIATSVPAGAPAIQFITVKEWGTWSQDVSNPATDFGFQLDYSVFRYAPTPLGTTGSIDIDAMFHPDGTWEASYTLNAGVAVPPYADKPWERFQITVTNTIQVDGAAPSGSFIEKQGMQIIVPEPATVALLVMGIGSLAIRRRR
jgi:hypothetical protein